MERIRQILFLSPEPGMQSTGTSERVHSGIDRGYA